MDVQELNFVKEKNLGNFSQLEKMIIEGQEVPVYFKELFNLTKKYINKRHMVTKKPQTYTRNNLGEIDEIDLEITENEILAKNLILNAVVDDSWRVTFLNIGELNIKKLRYFLGHTTPDGNMSLKLFDKIGNKALQKVIKGLCYYEDQIIRQNLEKHEVGTNLFTLNQKEKQNIVEKELNEFVEYLLSFSYDFIWGKRNETVNKLLEDCLIRRSKNAIKNKQRLVEILTNYMTLRELENNPIENHTLDRFMLTKTL